MKLNEIAIPITQLQGIGDATAKHFAHLGIFTVSDLLSYWPRTYDDRTKYIPLSEFNKSKVNTIATVIAHEWFGYGKMKTLKLIVQDKTGRAELVCFNRPFMEKSFPIGSIIQLNGTFSVKYGKLQSTFFEAEALKTVNEGEFFKNQSVLPIYPLTAGLTQNAVRKAVKQALKQYAKGIENEIPEEIIKRHKLLSKNQSLHAIHLPKNLEQAEYAKNTLIFEELYLFQRQIALRSLKHRGKLPDESAFNSTDGILKSAKSENNEIEIENAGNLNAGAGAETVNTSDATILNNSNNAQNGESTKNKLSNSIINEQFLTELSPRQKILLKNLPFELSIDQKKSIAEINYDIDCSFLPKKTYSMARLLQGDVGSGKTLVAFFACLRICDYGGQAAILAPTELLARQHSENAAKMLENTEVSLAFLTGNIKSSGRKELLQQLKNGNIDIVIGTHALFSHNVQYKDLRLAIIDEQHRFGVLQRNSILEKGRKYITNDGEITKNYDFADFSKIEKNAKDKFFENEIPKSIVPNLLMMSATPIPQSLALSVFGDLDVSVIKSMPQGRLPIKTHLTRRGSEINVHNFVRAELEKGRQCYFVYPLIEQGETDEEMGFGNGLKSAEEMSVFLQEKVFAQYKVALIHSKIEETMQKQIMTDFKNGKINILVATSVVEVGVDVPNATCMVIEHAERFGLAALHQLRGRVGRSSLQSHCFLIYSNNLSESGKERLKALYESNDGFYIAEQDLKLRGPGEVLGIQQSGYLSLSIADPIRDEKIMQIARTEAFNQIRKENGLV